MHEQHELDAAVGAVEVAGGTAAAYADLRARGFSVVESMYVVVRAFGVTVLAAAEAMTASGVWEDRAHHVERGTGIAVKRERAGLVRTYLRARAAQRGAAG
jgi:hypothetical protein